jgi:hypothetical protein
MSGNDPNRAWQSKAADGRQRPFTGSGFAPWLHDNHCSPYRPNLALVGQVFVIPI